MPNGTKVLVAGIGNMFLGDDGFGVEVARRVRSIISADRARVLDIGLRSRDLAYEMMESQYETTILIDAAARGGPAGTLYVLEPVVADQPARPVGGHDIRLEDVFRMLRLFGGSAGRVVIVGCEPARIEATGLSPAVAQAVDEAVPLVLRLIDEALETAMTTAR